VIKSRIRWDGHVAGMREKREAHRVLVEKPEGKRPPGDHLDDPGVNGRIILRSIFRKWDGALSGLIWLRIGTHGRLL